jgi:outer membrane protein assembly factor BamB
MKCAAWLASIALVFCVAAHGEDLAPGAREAWPAWRGPLATGVAPAANPPVRWSEDTNVLWKVALPGLGHSTPVVWGDRIFLTTAVETRQAVDSNTVKAAADQLPEWQKKSARLPNRVIQFVVLALRRSDGAVLWKQTVCEEAPRAGTHADGSWASGSPVTDGRHVYACFGSYGLYCLDMDGKKQWEKRFGIMKVKADFGEGASPVLYGDQVFMNWDQEGASFLVALDKRTGAERWRVNRDEATSWSTPLIVEGHDKPQVIVSATKRIRSYDLAKGTLLWECAGMTANVIPCPVADAKTLFCMSGFRGSALLAIRLAAATGDITGNPDAIAWTRQKDTPYVPSPLLHDGWLYFTKGNDALLTCVEAATGKPQYEVQPLAGLKGLYASPVAAANRLYITGRNGVTLVVKAGPAFDVLATNPLADSFSASAAVAGRELYLRGHKALYCIAER